jgi:hypothetical protein
MRFHEGERGEEKMQAMPDKDLTFHSTVLRSLKCTEGLTASQQRRMSTLLMAGKDRNNNNKLSELPVKVT